jgi:hypothetical protein
MARSNLFCSNEIRGHGQLQHSVNDKPCGLAYSTVAPCASTKATKFLQIRIHCHPDFLEACDNYQFARYPMKTGFKKEILVRAESLKAVAAEGVSEYSETKDWVHFRNATGLVMSCRLSREEYPSLAHALEIEDEKVELPKGLKKAAAAAEIISSTNKDGEMVTVSIRDNELCLQAEGDSGWYEETKRINYDGPPLFVSAPPKVLQDLTKQNVGVFFTKEKLKMDAGAYQFVAVLGTPEPLQIDDHEMEQLWKQQQKLQEQGKK